MQNLSKKIQKKMKELQFNYEPKDEKEKEEIDSVLMQAKDLLEYRNKIIDAFKDGTFLSEHLKKSDAAACKYVLEYVNKLIEEIKSMQEKINLSLFEECFESSSPANYAKMLNNIKNQDENKKKVEEIENRISDLKDRIKRITIKMLNFFLLCIKS